MSEPTEREWQIARDVDAAIVKAGELDDLAQAERESQRLIAEALAAHREQLLTEHATAFAWSPGSPRYLAVYGAVVAAEALRIERAGFELDDETMRGVVERARRIAQRSEDVQP